MKTKEGNGRRKAKGGRQMKEDKRRKTDEGRQKAEDKICVLGPRQ